MKSTMPVGIFIFLTTEIVGIVLAINAPAGMFRGSAAPDGSKVTGKTMKYTEKSIENPQAFLGKKCHEPRPKALFCYSLVRTPPEPTAALLANQLSAACDGWAFFGDTEDPANNVTKGFERIDFAHYKLMGSPGAHYKATRSVWKHLVESGALEEYEWFLRVEPDSFVRPSTLRQTFKALHTSCRRGGYMCSDNINEGYFLALQADVVLGIKSLGWPTGSCDNVLSGHSNSVRPCIERLNRIERLNISSMGALTDPEGNNLVAQLSEKDPNIARVLLARPHQRICLNDDYLPKCVSEHFVVVHFVKSVLDYSALMHAFP